MLDAFKKQSVQYIEDFKVFAEGGVRVDDTLNKLVSHKIISRVRKYD